MRPEEELRFLILAAQREGSRNLSAQLAAVKLTPSQAEVVRCLAGHGPLSLRALGELLVCESGSPSRLVDALVKRAIVVRREDAGDRRQVTLALTSTGQMLDAAVRLIEDRMYAMIGKQLGEAGMASTLALLRPLVTGSISGQAIARRKAMG
ncbi:MAG: MarR family transcriptional regulator [Devosia sp.]